jgi:LysM repeat protein
MFHRSLRRAGVIFVITLVLMGVLLPAVASAAPAAAPAQQAGGFWYTVQPGDNLSRIAARYGSTVQAIMRANNLHTSVIQPGQVLFIPTHGGGGGGGGRHCAHTHYVQRGENLSMIARWYGVSVHQLVAANNIHNPSHIYVGQKLCIPSGGYYPPKPAPYPPPPPAHSCPQYYTVQPGNTLSGIAKWCGTSVHHLAKLNGISNPSHIYVGQVIRIW